MATSCLNCGTEIAGKYCLNCGQKTYTPRITFSYLAGEFLHAFAHADKGLFNLVKSLAINPGRVAAEYVEGRRKRYFNPFGFLTICIAISFPIYNLINQRRIFHSLNLKICRAYLLNWNCWLLMQKTGHRLFRISSISFKTGFFFLYGVNKNADGRQRIIAVNETSRLLKSYRQDKFFLRPA